MTWKKIKNKKKVLINKADDHVKPVVTLISPDGGLVIVAKEQETYTAYIKLDNGFSYYQPIQYWFNEVILAVSEYINTKKAPAYYQGINYNDKLSS